MYHLIYEASYIITFPHIQEDIPIIGQKINSIVVLTLNKLPNLGKSGY